MIPQRTSYRIVNNENSETALRDRVTACRKRIRENRMMLKVQTKDHGTQLFLKAFPTAVQMSRCLFGPSEQTEEQEVGIT